MATNALTADERKRMHADIKNDSAYKRSRSNLLIVSTLCATGLALVGLMVMKERISIDMAALVIGVCIVVYFVMIIGIVKARNAAEARWLHAQKTKKPKRKNS